MEEMKYNFVTRYMYRKMKMMGDILLELSTTGNNNQGYRYMG